MLPICDCLEIILSSASDNGFAPACTICEKLLVKTLAVFLLVSAILATFVSTSCNCDNKLSGITNPNPSAIFIFF